MRKVIFVLLLLASMAILSASNQPFVKEFFHENTILAGFTAESVNNRDGIINFTRNEGVVETGITGFDRVSAEYRFTDMEQMFGKIQNKDWNENGIYLQNIYRIKLERNDNIEQALTALLNEGTIVFAEYETINRIKSIPNDPLFGTQWHHPQVQAPQAWDYTTGSEEIIIGIVDSGIYFTHEDLKDNIWINEGETAGFDVENILATGNVTGGNGQDDDGNGYVDDVIGYNFYGTDNNDSYQDFGTNDHGTHVAGCAGAVGDNGIGVTGSSQNIKLISSRHAPTNQDYPYVQDGYSGITYCADNGASVINCSWGGPGSGTVPNSVINYATSAGALVVTAAGNDDTEHNTSYQDYPSDCTNAICVAATDQNDEKTSFSDYGLPIDISCPGIAIKSTVISGSGYESFQGTSMASPIVAGIAALVLSVHPELDPLALRARLMDTSDYIDIINPDYAGLLGAGRVNSFQAVMYDIIPSLTIESSHFYEVDGSGDGDGVPNPGEICNLELMLQNGFFSGGFWAEANGVTVTVSSTEPSVNFLDGSNVYTIDNIGLAGSVWNYDTPVKIQIPADSDLQEVELNVNITANDTNEFPYFTDITYPVVFSLNQAGFPFELGTSTTSAPVFSTLSDSVSVVFGDVNGNLHALAYTGEELSGFPVMVGGNISSAAAIADINNDGAKEIVVTTETGKIVAIDADGSIIFEYTAGGIFKSNPMIADVNDDGDLEIIAVTFSGNQCVVLNSDGTDFSGFPFSLPNGGTLSSPAIGDIDSDGNLDIVAVSLSGAVYAVSTSSASMLPGWPATIGANSWGGPIITNIDGDEDPEIIAIHSNGNVFAFNHDASEVFNRTIGSQIKGSAVTADLNNNGSVEIIFTTSAGDLYVVNNTGANISGFPINFDTQFESTPILADMDGNGTIDILFGGNNGMLHSIDFDGNETRNFPYSVGSTVNTSAAFGDLDGDGDLEIAVPNQTGMMVLDYKINVPESDIAWACLKRNASRTGNAFDSAIGTTPNETPELVTNLDSNYPNPFNPTTNISFSLKNDEVVSLQVFNVKGQLVKTLVNEKMVKGNHKAIWNGKDNSGKAASSGIYFYKLETDSFNSVKKMVMMK